MILLTRQQTKALAQILSESGQVTGVRIEPITSEVLKGSIAVVLMYAGGTRNDKTRVINLDGKVMEV